MGRVHNFDGGLLPAFDRDVGGAGESRSEEGQNLMINSNSNNSCICWARWGV